MTVQCKVCSNTDNCSFPPPAVFTADPRRPYPQDIEMRSGFLGGFSTPEAPPDTSPQPEQGKFSADLAPSASEPPEKKIALEKKSGAMVLQGRKFISLLSILTAFISKYHKVEPLSKVYIYISLFFSSNPFIIGTVYIVLQSIFPSSFPQAQISQSNIHSILSVSAVSYNYVKVSLV